MVFNIHPFWWRFVIRIPCGQLTLHLFLFKHDRSILTGCYCLLQNVNPMNIIYRLSLTFGLLVLPEYTLFSHAALVEATREDHSKYGCLRHQWPGRWICVDFKLTSDFVFLHSDEYYERILRREELLHHNWTPGPRHKLSRNGRQAWALGWPLYGVRC